MMSLAIYLMLTILGTSAVAMGQEQSPSLQDVLARLKDPSNITTELARIPTGNPEDTNRDEDPGGLEWYSSYLNSSSDYAGVVYAFIYSNEYRNQTPRNP